MCVCMFVCVCVCACVCDFLCVCLTEWADHVRMRAYSRVQCEDEVGAGRVWVAVSKMAEWSSEETVINSFTFRPLFDSPINQIY